MFQSRITEVKNNLTEMSDVDIDVDGENNCFLQVFYDRKCNYS